MVETDGRAQLEKLEYPKECKQCPRRATKSFLLLLKFGIPLQACGSSQAPKLSTEIPGLSKGSC